VSTDLATLAKANRQMVAERADLLAQLAHSQQVIKQRSADTAVQFVEGLGALLDNATRNDPASIKVLEQLSERLERAKALRSRIVLPPGGNGASS
jgi:hypothetical protein